VNRMISAGVFGLAAILVAPPLCAQSAAPAAEARSVEQVVRDVYDLVSWKDGNTPDWDVVRDVFIPQAIVVLRYPPALQVMSVDEFLLDWLRFEDQLAERGADGFTEKVVSAHTTEFGDIAHVHAVNFDRSVRYIIEAREQVDDGGLARARRTDDGDGLPRFGGE